jgi:hypothetical protein
MDAHERWGYVLWGSVGAIVAIPEITAAIWNKAPWPTISGTIGHLEYVWSPTSIIVVAVIVATAAHLLRSRPDRRVATRTAGGRTARAPVPPQTQETGFWGYVYLATAPLAVFLPSVLTAIFLRGSSVDTKWILGYVIYGLIGLFCILLPSVVAYTAGKDVPFQTLFRTLADLQRRAHYVALVVVAGLAVLLVHLAFYPWPDIAHILQQQPPKPSSP